jgi:hypothetical protein
MTFFEFLSLSKTTKSFICQIQSICAVALHFTFFIFSISYGSTYFNRSVDLGEFIKIELT